MTPPAAPTPGEDLGLEHVHRGKVRDLYAVGDDQLLMVASDRLSAFDVVMAEPVPDKGRVLTAMSAHWFDELSGVIGNHLISTDVADLPESARRPELAGRIMLCRRAEMLPIECIVRAFVAGSSWKEYRTSGTIHGEAVPAGLVEADRLPEPRFTPPAVPRRRWRTACRESSPARRRCGCGRRSPGPGVRRRAPPATPARRRPGRG